MVGSFHLTRRAFLRPNASDLVLGGLGAVQLVLELVTAIRAIMLFPSLRSCAREADTKTVARRARCGRIALYTSLGYLFVAIRLPVWTTYIEVLNNSTFVRNLVLRSDNARTGRRLGLAYVREPTAEEKRANSYQHMITLSIEDAGFGRFDEARDSVPRDHRVDRFAGRGCAGRDRAAEAAGDGEQQPGVAGGYLFGRSFLEPARLGRARAASNGGSARGRELLEHIGRGPLPCRPVGGSEGRSRPGNVASQRRRQLRLVLRGARRAQARTRGGGPGLV